MVHTRKFSEFAIAQQNNADQEVVGLENGINVQSKRILTWTTSGRPASPYNGLMGLNTDLQQFEWWDADILQWTQFEDSGDIADVFARLAAHTAGDGASLIGLQDQSNVTNKTVQDLANATIIAQNDNGTLQNAQFTGSLTTGIVKNTTGTGVLSISAPLTSIDNLTTAADETIYLTAPNTYAVTALTAGARLFLADPTKITTLTGLIEQPSGIADTLNRLVLGFTYVASSVNNLNLTNAATGNSPILSVLGTDSNINIKYESKGSGEHLFQSPTGTVVISLQPNSNSNNFEGQFSIPSISANRIYTFPDASGTIAFTNTPDQWIDQTTTPVNLVVNTGYTSNAGATAITYLLPVNSAVGDWIEINGLGSGLYAIGQSAGQQIIFGDVSSTLGAGGQINSQSSNDNVRLRCLVANTIWTVVSAVGNFTII